jgi:O-antigen ligase
VEKDKTVLSILVAAPVIAVFFTSPDLFYDPFNVTRLMVISCFGASAFALILRNTEFKKKSIFIPPRLILFSFIFWLVVSWLIVDGNKTLSLFGTTGRNTGILAYISLASLTLLGSYYSSLISLEKSVFGLVLVSTLAGLYGILQYWNLDFASWNNPYNRVFSFFGNPNFHSAFMAMSLSALVALQVKSGFSRKIRVLLVGISLLMILNITMSESQQGFFAFGFAAFFMGLCWLVINKKSRFMKTSYTAAGTAAIVLIGLDLLQKLPWKSIFYTRSISERGVTWRAGWNMMLDHPIFGIGMDQYRDNFRFYKEKSEFSESFVNSNSSSSHNVLLDIGAGGGIGLASIYVGLIAITIFSIYRVVKRSNMWNPYFMAISATWVAYQIQSMISINQLGLAVWGWVFCGLIIGYELNTREHQTKSNQTSVKRYSAISALIGGLAGLSLSVQPVINNYQYFQGLKTGNVSEIEKSLERWPKNDVYMILMAQRYEQSNLYDYAYKIAKTAVEFNPRYFEGWEALSRNPIASEAEKKFANARLLELSPNYFLTK